tara:strand:- start:649 stop:876 length:228 start_codon:yes stop_codon:yes gene_type:complete
MNNNDLVKEWNRRASVLNNMQIKKVYYEKDEYTGRYGVVIELYLGFKLWIMSDDEGNDVGAIHTNIEQLPSLPRI